ncbi:MAG TPA: hypothetical protein VJK54_05745 [Chthoniobacterales bacterium]|nr:hypothetical protein [Chthoniobacterales bacterium]
MNIQPTQNIRLLAPLANVGREEQLNHIDQHIGNFQGIFIHQVPINERGSINVILNHAAAIHDRFFANMYVHTDEEFNHAINTALQHLNTASEMIAQHQQQSSVVPGNNAANNQVDGGNDTDSTRESDQTHMSDFTQPSSLGSINSDLSNNTENLEAMQVDNIEGHEENADPLAAQLMHASPEAVPFQPIAPNDI